MRHYNTRVAVSRNTFTFSLHADKFKKGSKGSKNQESIRWKSCTS